jgi:hypothetical protein
MPDAAQPEATVQMFVGRKHAANARHIQRKVL